MMITFVAKAKLPTCFGKYIIHAFRDGLGKEHVALVSGRITDKPVLVRVHSRCLTGDTLCSLKCDCRAQLEASLCMIAKKGGVLVYLDQEGRGIGLANKIKAYSLQDKGKDTVEANVELGFAPDMREYSAAAEILEFLKVRKIKLITNNPDKLLGVKNGGIPIVERIPLNTKPNRFNRAYLRTKKTKLNHF
jgi:3,4-dihydroxy 2-butanone 4-phosphate synthase/GTP cyclohydrolase II